MSKNFRAGEVVVLVGEFSTNPPPGKLVGAVRLQLGVFGRVLQVSGRKLEVAYELMPAHVPRQYIGYHTADILIGTIFPERDAQIDNFEGKTGQPTHSGFQPSHIYSLEAAYFVAWNRTFEELVQQTQRTIRKTFSTWPPT